MKTFRKDTPETGEMNGPGGCPVVYVDKLLVVIAIIAILAECFCPH